MSIDSKNALKIRPRMDVYIGAVDYDKSLDVDLVFRKTGSSSSTTILWPNTNYNGYAFGYPSGMFTSSGDFYVNITENNSVNIPYLYLLLKYTGTWKVGWHGYALQTAAPMMLLNMGSYSDRLDFDLTSTTGQMEVIGIIPCGSKGFVADNDSIITCDLSLNSSLNVYEPTFEVSTIEAGIYKTGLSISNVASMNDSMPIVYMSGYVGDEMCDPRFFYLAEPPTYENNLLTITAEDASAALEEYTVESQVVVFGLEDAHVKLYNVLLNTLSGCGISLKSSEADPATFTTDTNSERAIIKEQTGRDLIAEIMATCRFSLDDINTSHTFWPTFVDAGIPVVRWQLYDADAPLYGPFNISESEVAEHKRAADRLTLYLQGEGDFGLSSYVYDATGSSESIGSVTVRKSHTYTQTFDNYYRSVSVSRSTTPKTVSASRAVWKASSAGTSNLTGVLMDIEIDTVKLKNSGTGVGITRLFEPKILGQFKAQIDANLTEQEVPDYTTTLATSNEYGSFVWKGDPRMQPRDPFYFTRLNGTVETCTIERIELSHEGGGTQATIYYRKGIC